MSNKKKLPVEKRPPTTEQIDVTVTQFSAFFRKFLETSPLANRASVQKLINTHGVEKHLVHQFMYMLQNLEDETHWPDLSNRAVRKFMKVFSECSGTELHLQILCRYPDLIHLLLENIEDLDAKNALREAEAKSATERVSKSTKTEINTVH